MKPYDILLEVTKFLEESARKGMEGRDLFVALRATELRIAESIERRWGPRELAMLQEIAFEVSKRLHTQEIHEDGTPWPEEAKT